MNAKLISMPTDKCNIHNDILNEFYEKSRKELTLRQKRNLIKNHNEILSMDLLTDKLNHFQIFISKKYNKKIIVFSFFGDECLFEVSEN